MSREMTAIRELEKRVRILEEHTNLRPTTLEIQDANTQGSQGQDQGQREEQKASDHPKGESYQSGETEVSGEEE